MARKPGRNRPHETVASFEAALDRDPDNAEVWHACGETMNRLARPKKALPLLGEWDRALDHLLPVLERVPRFVPARCRLPAVIRVKTPATRP